MLKSEECTNFFSFLFSNANKIIDAVGLAEINNDNLGEFIKKRIDFFEDENLESFIRLNDSLDAKTLLKALDEIAADKIEVIKLINEINQEKIYGSGGIREHKKVAIEKIIKSTHEI